MTIELYSGTPGSGKSLHATRDVRDYLKYKKLPVIANYEIDVSSFDDPVFLYFRNSDLTVEKLVKFAGEYWKNHNFREDNILLVLDECQLLFNSREWARKDRMQWLEFFSQHRKYGYRIIFVAQYDKMVDRQIRALIEYEHVHRKLGNLGRWGIFFKILTAGEVFTDIVKYYPLNQKIATRFFKSHKSIRDMYNSYTTFEHDTERMADCAPARREGAVGGSLRRAAA